MTVCIAALAAKSKAIVLVADKAITYTSHSSALLQWERYWTVQEPPELMGEPKKLCDKSFQTSGDALPGDFEKNGLHLLVPPNFTRHDPPKCVFKWSQRGDFGPPLTGEGKS